MLSFILAPPPLRFFVQDDDGGSLGERDLVWTGGLISVKCYTCVLRWTRRRWRWRPVVLLFSSNLFDVVGWEETLLAVELTHPPAILILGKDGDQVSGR